LKKHFGQNKLPTIHIFIGYKQLRYLTFINIKKFNKYIQTNIFDYIIFLFLTLNKIRIFFAIVAVICNFTSKSDYNYKIYHFRKNNTLDTLKNGHYIFELTFLLLN